MKTKLLILLSLFLSGCATTPKTVYVPTPVKCPKPNIPIQPYYPVYDLTDADKTHSDKIMKAYALSLKMCVGQNKMMRKQLEGYK